MRAHSLLSCSLPPSFFLTQCCSRLSYSPGRPHNSLFKLCLTDGVRRCVAVEHRAIEGLSGDTPAGCKLVLTHPHIRQGMLMLTSACCVILGGCVTRLEKARLAVRERWNEPPGSAVLQAARARSTNGSLLPPPGGPLAAGGQVAPPSRREMAIAAAWAFETGPPANAGAGGPAGNGNHAAAVPGGGAHQAPAAPAAHVNHHAAGMSEADLFGDDDFLDCDPAVLAVVTNGVAPAPQATPPVAPPASGAVSPLPRAVHQLIHAQQQHRGGLDALFPPAGVEPDINFPMEEDAIPPAVPAAKPTFVKASSMVGGGRGSTEKDHSGPSLNGGAAQPPVVQRGGMPASASAPPSQASLSVSTHGGGTHQAPAAIVHSTPSSLEPGLAGPPFTYLAALLARSGHASPAGLRSPVSHGSGDGGASHGFLVGTILGFVGTLTCFKHEGRDDYDMRVVVEDGSGAVEARVDGGLLARRLGVTPARDLKTAMERDPHVKQAVLKLTKTLQRGFGTIRIQVPRQTTPSPSHPDALMPVVLALPDDEAQVDWSAASDPGVRSHVRLVGQQLLSRLKQAPPRDDAMRF